MRTLVRQASSLSLVIAALNELDCVGVVVVKFTPSRVVFRLGAFYAAAKLALAPKDAFTIGVSSARVHGHVRYR